MLSEYTHTVYRTLLGAGVSNNVLLLRGLDAQVQGSELVRPKLAPKRRTIMARHAALFSMVRILKMQTIAQTTVQACKVENGPAQHHKWAPYIDTSVHD